MLLDDESEEVVGRYVGSKLIDSLDAVNQVLDDIVANRTSLLDIELDLGVSVAVYETYQTEEHTIEHRLNFVIATGMYYDQEIIPVGEQQEGDIAVFDEESNIIHYLRNISFLRQTVTFYEYVSNDTDEINYTVTFDTSVIDITTDVIRENLEEPPPSCQDTKY